MLVAHTLAVDGYIKANSENTVSSSSGDSGGSGGSIHIQTHNFTGERSVASFGRYLSLCSIDTQQQTAFENNVGKGEIARNEQFLLYRPCFQLK